jgi:predicted LPLAT superfamily acyltransferase
MTFKCCAIIPSRNHYRVVGDIVRSLRSANLYVFLVDDGSDEPAQGALQSLHAPESGVTVYRLDVNQGKGGAVAAGLGLAEKAGFTHAVQVDADGQHDLGALADLVAAARANPNALVIGQPVYDQSVPTGRRIGRWITHFWVSVELLSPRVIDTMCGFRVYPVTVTRAVIAAERVGRRMDFDIEIVVRLAWRGVAPVTLPVRVIYPEDNTSNFDLVRDNWRISRMHTRLVFTMLARLPRILGNRRRRPEGWFALAERGMLWGLRLSAAIYRIAGPRVCKSALLPVVLYFHFTGTTQRRASLTYLRRAFAARGEAREPGWRDSFRHFRAFTERTVDSFGSWVDRAGACVIDPASAAALDAAKTEDRGLVLVVSHFGNVELSRALLDHKQRARITVLVHTRHAENYNRLLKQFSPDAVVNTIQVTEIGPDTVIALRETVDRGGWIAIAGDRTPVHAQQRVSRASFLGKEAPFPQGPYVLAHLLDCPLYTLTCLRDGEVHRLYFEQLAERVNLPPRHKEPRLAELTARYASRLEEFCLRHPYQWYNFYDFWAEIPPSTNAKSR